MTEQNFGEALKPEYHKTYEKLQLEELDTEEILFVLDVIKTYSYLFSHSSIVLTPILEHRIITKTENVFKNPFTKLSKFTAQQQSDIYLQINTLLSMKVIEASNSDFNNGIVVSQQNLTSTGEPSWRIKVPFTTLNYRIISQQYVYKRISEIRKLIREKQYFSIIHMEELYQRINIEPEDAKKTAFTTPVGKYQFNRLSPLIKGSEVTFLNLLKSIFLNADEDKIIFLPIGLIIATHTIEQHKSVLTYILDTLLFRVLPLDPSNFKFFRPIDTCYEYLNQVLTIPNCKAESPNYDGELQINLELQETGFTTALYKKNSKNIIPIINSTRNFQGPEKLYNTHERTCFAIVHSLRRFKTFIGDNRVTIYDGQNNSKWMETVLYGFKYTQWLLDIEKFNWTYSPSDQIRNHSITSL